MAKFALAASTLLVASAAVASAHEGHEHSSSTGSATSGTVASTHEGHEHSSSSGSATSGTVGSSQECSANVSEAFIATIDNSTYFDTCAEGATFTVSSVFDVLNFTDADFLTFCNSSTCLEPLHELMGSEDCLITYEGAARDLSAEISQLHDQCHEVLDAAGLDMNMGEDSHAHGSGSTASASGSSGASTVVMTVGSVVSAAILAAFLA
ncbi:hypothetical protein PHYPSEUDO_001810 [Phytophthora pseudosyringae]|uniref:Elicitin-like protein n=1 Tax=Phytophthora pseudosyringae TaxID=221518 RepID=A0A8T1VUQ2_9STRA|nr:hypothetical protein PHYPSEUDO_001810 [Phytophthora pseudosyringae]